MNRGPKSTHLPGPPYGPQIRSLQLVDRVPGGVSLAKKVTNIHVYSNGPCACLSKEIELDQLLRLRDETYWKMFSIVPGIMNDQYQTFAVVGYARQTYITGRPTPKLS